MRVRHNGQATGRSLAALVFLLSVLGGGAAITGCHTHVHPGPPGHRHPHLRGHLRGHGHRVCHRHAGHWRWHCHP